MPERRDNGAQMPAFKLKLTVFAVLVVLFLAGQVTLRGFGGQWARDVYWPILAEHVQAARQGSQYGEAERHYVNALRATPAYAERIVAATGDELVVMPRLAAELTQLLRTQDVPVTNSESEAMLARVLFARGQWSELLALEAPTPEVEDLQRRALYGRGDWAGLAARPPKRCDVDMPADALDAARNLLQAGRFEATVALLRPLLEEGRHLPASATLCAQALECRMHRHAHHDAALAQQAQEVYSAAVLSSSSALDAARGLLRMTRTQ